MLFVPGSAAFMLLFVHGGAAFRLLYVHGSAAISLLLGSAARFDAAAGWACLARSRGAARGNRPSGARRAA